MKKPKSKFASGTSKKTKIDLAEDASAAKRTLKAGKAEKGVQKKSKGSKKMC